MEEELNKALAEFIVACVEVKDFALEQAPDVIQQLIKYKIFETVSFCVLSAYLLVACIIIITYPLKSGKQLFEHSDPTGWGALFLFACGAGALSFLFLISKILFLLKLIIAPKVYLIEYASNML